MENLKEKVHSRESREQRDLMKRITTIGWGLFFIWVGFAWLMGYGLGWGLLGVGILTIAVQALRYLFHVKVEGFWLIVGMAFFAAGFWELWSLEIPLAPVLLILLGIGLLLRYFMHKLSGRESIF